MSNEWLMEKKTSRRGQYRMFLWRNVDTSLSSVDDITPYDIFRFLDATRGGDTENF